uniref:Uncharacterized protein n=1 Tax=Rhizophora mucronata TaxID=61149 RepID=A0A2P2KRX7_RHIMU
MDLVWRDSNGRKCGFAKHGAMMSLCFCNFQSLNR